MYVANHWYHAEEPASTHKATSAEDKHNLDVKDQQNQEAVGSTLESDLGP